jgi:N-acetyl-anhydromuramyl-L-alanine amidase AmpD
VAQDAGSQECERATPKSLSPGRQIIQLPLAKPGYNCAAWADREVRAIVLHDTEAPPGSTTESILDWFKKAAYVPHYFVTRKGEVYQFVDDDMVTFHVQACNRWRPPWCEPEGQRFSNANALSVGIELERVRGQNRYPDSLYGATIWLVKRLALRHGIPISREYIVGHGELQLDRGDPAGFDWDRLMKGLF